MNPIILSALESFPQQLEAHYAAIPADFEAPDSLLFRHNGRTMTA